MLNTIINNYFGFNRQQRNGLLVLLFIIIFLLAVRIIYPYFLTPDQILLSNLPLLNESNDKISGSHVSSGKLIFFEFDPNRVKERQLIQLGFKPWIAARIVKARKNGFVFYRDKDLLKIHGITPEFYSTVAPFIKISGKNKTEHQPASNKSALVVQTAKHVELNGADSLALIDLPGIGPAFARRIIKYRNSLGGFYNTEQLKEVYGFKQEQFDKLKGLVSVDASKVVKLNINKDDFKTVNRHPYLSYELTKEIFNARYKKPLDEPMLRQILVDESLVLKVLPYIVFN